MTGQLKTTMERHADALAAPVLDLDAIMRNGRGRRRRRTALIGGLAAAAVVVAGGIALGTGRQGHDTTADQYAGLGDTSFTYAIGSVLHSGDTTVDLGADIASYVQTSTGVVFTDPQHRVYVVDDAAPRQIGTSTASSTLVADDAGVTVAWVDGDRLEIYQMGSQGPVSVPVQRPASGESPVVHAISGGLVWFWDARGTMTYQVDRQRLDEVTGRDSSQAVQDVANGLVLAEVGGTSGGGGLAVRAVGANWAFDGTAPETSNIYSGDLAPDGQHWFTQDSDQFAVFDSQTGQRTDPPHPGFEFAAPYRWLDDDTIAVLALPTVKDAAKAPVSLLTCHVSADTCTVTASDIGTSSQIAIPVGQAIGG